MLTIIEIYIIPVVLAYILLGLFYKLFQATWPDLYFSTSDITGYYISVTPLRYFAFRLVPVIIIVSLVLGVFGKNLSQNIINYIGINIGIIYGGSTHGLAILKLLTKEKSVQRYFNTYTQYLFHVLSFSLILLVSYLAAYVSKSEIVAKLTPTFSGLIDNIWASLITVLIASYLYKIYQGKDINTDEIFDNSLKKLRPELVELIENYSVNKNANINLVKAVCIVENIQRPAWVRKVEYMKSFIVNKGTYGIMQMLSEKPLSDKQSIQQAIDTYFVNSKDLLNENIQSIVRLYNQDDRYIDLVMAAYEHLAPYGKG